MLQQFIEHALPPLRMTPAHVISRLARFITILLVAASRTRYITACCCLATAIVEALID
jgi:hypothetical protein